MNKEDNHLQRDFDAAQVLAYYLGNTSIQFLCLFYQDIPINWHAFQDKQSVKGKCLIIRLRVNQKISQ